MSGTFTLCYSTLASAVANAISDPDAFLPNPTRDPVPELSFDHATLLHRESRLLEEWRRSSHRHEQLWRAQLEQDAQLLQLGFAKLSDANLLDTKTGKLVLGASDSAVLETCHFEYVLELQEGRIFESGHELPLLGELGEDLPSLGDSPLLRRIAISIIGKKIYRFS